MSHEQLGGGYSLLGALEEGGEGGGIHLTTVLLNLAVGNQERNVLKLSCVALLKQRDGLAEVLSGAEALHIHVAKQIEALLISFRGGFLGIFEGTGANLVAAWAGIELG